MRTLNLHGIFPAIVTPFCSDESLDEAGLRRLVRHLLPHVDGILVNGTTGDFPLLTPAERLRALTIVREEVGCDKLVLAGTGAVATRECAALTRAAWEAGADAALVLPSYYLKPSAEGVRQHFIAVAAAVPELPLLLYNIPQLVGQPIPPAVVSALQDVPNIVGIKDSSGDLRYTLAVCQAVRPEFGVLVGEGTLVLPALALGATGAILAVANLIPAEYRQLLQAMDRGDLTAARELQRRTHPVSHLVSQYGSLLLREGLARLGIPVGPARQPLCAADVIGDAQRAALQAALHGLGYL